MEVIVIQSEAFQQIIRKIEEVKTMICEVKNKQPFTEIWLDNKQVCELLGISTRTLQSYRDEGKIGFSQIGSKIYYKASDIESFLNKHYNKAFKR